MTTREPELESVLGEERTDFELGKHCKTRDGLKYKLISM